MYLLLLEGDSPAGQSQAVNALGTIASQGVLGALCVILIVATFYSIKALLKAKDDRINDQKLMTETLQKLNEASKDLTIEMNKSASQLVGEANRSNDGLKMVMASQERSLEELARNIANLHQEHVRLSIVLSNKRDR